MVLTREVEGQGLSGLGGQGTLPIMEEDRNPRSSPESVRAPVGMRFLAKRGQGAVTQTLGDS